MIATKSRVAIFEVLRLFPDDWLSNRDIAQLSGLSPSTVTHSTSAFVECKLAERLDIHPQCRFRLAKGCEGTRAAKRLLKAAEYLES